MAALLAALGAGALAFLAGFAVFVIDARRDSPWPDNADGIAALTGGAQRIEAAVSLLQAGVADRLLISGVGEGVRLPDILRSAMSDLPAAMPVSTGSVRPRVTPRLTPRITLGHQARTTEGNAIEIAWWARENGLHSLVVVTAGYHMRRALGDVRTLLPGVRLAAYAVHPGASMQRLLIEYLKLIAATLGVRHRPFPPKLA